MRAFGTWLCTLKPLMAVLSGLIVPTKVTVFVPESPQRAHLVILAGDEDLLRNEFSRRRIVADEGHLYGRTMTPFTVTRS